MNTIYFIQVNVMVLLCYQKGYHTIHGSYGNHVDEKSRQKTCFHHPQLHRQKPRNPGLEVIDRNRLVGDLGLAFSKGFSMERTRGFGAVYGS